MSVRSVVAFAILGGAAIGVGYLIYRERKLTTSKPRGRASRFADVADVEGGQEVLRAMPDRWWTRRAPRESKLCYATKTDALNKFREWNQAVIDDYGGETAQGSRGEFDAMTKHGALPKNIAEALWIALPPEKTRYGKGPFCLEDIDVQALNETSAGQHSRSGFTLPEYVAERLIDREYDDYYRREVAGVRRRVLKKAA